jgi:gluconolactonase
LKDILNLDSHQENKFMKKLTILLLLITSLVSRAQESTPPTGSVEDLSGKLSGVIRQNARVEVIAEGFLFTEGPLWVEQEKMLLLSDVPGNTIYKWTEAKGKEVFVKPAGYTDSTKRGGFMGPNGLILAKDKSLWLCQHGDRRIAKLAAPWNAPTASFTTVVGEYNGKRLNSPNDLTLSKGGDLYFTDPAYGFENGPGDPKKELAFQGVYKLDTKGKVMLLVDSISHPNGIGLMPDGKTLLVSNSNPRKKYWYAYTIAKDGSLTQGRIFFDASRDTSPGLCDGFKIDSKGNVFASGPGGIWIFNRTGELLGKINLNGVTASNCALSPDEKTLYITAVQYLLRVKMR